MKHPTPGSKEAIDKGCKCPVIDNHYGKGIVMNGSDEPNFWVSGDCKTHGK